MFCGALRLTSLVSVTPQGLEPQLTVPETVVLPLHHGVVDQEEIKNLSCAGMYQSPPIM